MNELERLDRTFQFLSTIKDCYAIAVDEYMVPALPDVMDGAPLDHPQRHAKNQSPAQEMETKFLRSVRAAFRASPFIPSVFQALANVIRTECASLFKITNEGRVGRSEKEFSLKTLFESCSAAGLGGRPAVQAFAIAIDGVINEFVNGRLQEVDWVRQGSVLSLLRSWTQTALVSFIQDSVNQLGETEDLMLAKETIQWQDMILKRLGEVRVGVLFDYVSLWPKSKGPFLDLRSYTETIEGRHHLVEQFQSDLHRRLLHQGASTRDILDFYMQLIPSFVFLDSRAVLLDMVSTHIRDYLKTRTDTVRIIVASMLTTVSEKDDLRSNDISRPIAEEMLKPIATTAEPHRQDYDLDFDNMEWTPQPNDAGPEFRRNAQDDTTSQLLRLYDSKTFISMLAQILAEKLLSHATENHDREVHVIELFKSKFGKDETQGIEVMLNDIMKSKRLNKTILSDPGFASRLKKTGIKFDVTAVSSFFWPELREDASEVPERVNALYEDYSARYKERRKMQHLQYLPVLGTAMIQLHFKDGRKIEERVASYIAIVADAFGEQQDGSAVENLTFDELLEKTKLPDDLIRRAVNFLLGKRALQEVQKDKYAVLEDLSGAAGGGNALSAAVADDAGPAIKTAEDQLQEKAPLYRQFVNGMLTNAGQMPLKNIINMLKMALPGGFPFGEPELKLVLQPLVDEGKLVYHGDTYGVRRG
jgi:anaphase-promoting complex subunit 2